MAGVLHVLLLSATLLVHNGFGSAFHLEIHPKSVTELLTAEVSITCFASDSTLWTRSVVTIDLGKEDARPLAVLQQKRIEYSHDIEDNMKATGRIDLDNSTQSFLTLTITNPTIQDSAKYVCSMFYLDGFGQIQNSKVYANLTVHSQNMQVVVRYFMDKISSLENLSETKTLKTELLKQQEVNEKLQTQVDSLSMELKEMNKTLGMIKKENRLSAFLASVIGNESYYHDQKTVKYPYVKLNIGDDYSADTGIYTAPVHGLYVFHLLGATDSAGIDMDVDIRVNGEATSRMYAGDEDFVTQSSMSVVVELQPRDAVFVFVNYALSDLIKMYNFPLTTFCGYLIHPMK